MAPQDPSSAGIRVSATARVNSTVAIPASATGVKAGSPNTNRPDSEVATVSAENVTVRPAVAAVRSTACATGRPAARPSPNLFTMSRL